MTMNSHDVIATYEAMAVLTRQMVAAAQGNDWDRLVELERDCAAHVALLKAEEPPAALDGAARERKLDAIKQMLDDDRKIRDLTMPWMARLSALIGHTGTQRRLATAYGA